MRKRFLALRLFIWSLVIFLLCTMPTPKTEMPHLIPYTDKIVHWGMFLLFSGFAYSWLRKKTVFSPVVNYALVLLLVAIYGAAIEWLQGEYFNRSADAWDWVADMIGGVCGLVFYPQLHKLRMYFEEKLQNFITKK